MSLAAETRRAADEHPFLVAGLRADVVNFTAAARFLDVDGETDAVATALRRYADDLPDHEPTARDARVTMESGIGPVEALEDALLVVGGTALGRSDGTRTAILATGAIDADALRAALAALALEEIDVHAAGVGDGTMAIVVERLDGANAVRGVERALESVLE
ncbi:DUF7523 family protein [Natronoglomus mannanivorans]|uniref:Uncharacterized protein n=1 Tax=Natronoglomus mannanivorans TaxID=2979990 RepID=A0AAP3E122_9EURY|nr:hypothetical protein [Halobacteria archaeon AArc-xg1-1]